MQEDDAKYSTDKGGETIAILVRIVAKSIDGALNGTRSVTDADEATTSAECRRNAIQALRDIRRAEERSRTATCLGKSAVMTSLRMKTASLILA